MYYHYNKYAELRNFKAVHDIKMVRLYMTKPPGHYSVKRKSLMETVQQTTMHSTL